MLICDKRPRMRGDTHQAPQGGQIKTAPGLRPAPKALPRVGRHAPDPWAAPLARLAHRAPAASVIQQEGVPGTGATVAGVGNRLRLSMPDAQPLAVFGLLEKFSAWAAVARRGSGACPL